MVMMRQTVGAAFPLALMLAACGGNGQDARNEALASLDSRLTNAGSGPDAGANFSEDGGNAAALADTAATPAGAVGARLRAAAQEGGGLASGQRKGCVDALRYDDSWVDRMPAPFRPYAGSTHSEAAGAVTDHCTLVALTVVAPDAPEALLARYAKAARAAGYDAERDDMAADRGGDLRLGGTKGGDGPAYVILARPRSGGGGTEADILYVE